MALSKNRDDVLVTYSLGSCIGVSIWDPATGVGGMIHCMLPLSSMDPKKAKANPAMFVDTGIPAFLQAAFDMGARKASLVVKLAGAAKVLEQADHFKVGQRNYTVFRKVLWKNGILIAAEDIGGERARTMYLDIATGHTRIKSNGREVGL